MTPFEAVVIALAVYRITRLVTDDTILEPIRERVLARFPAYDTEYADDPGVESPTNAYGRALFESAPGRYFPVEASWFGTLISCSWCASVWVAALVTAAWYWLPTATWWVALPLAFSAIAALIADKT